MWNVCAEPIECCVYIKATLFLTIPALSSVSDCPQLKSQPQRRPLGVGPNTQSCFNLARELRLDQEIRLNIMRMNHF